MDKTKIVNNQKVLTKEELLEIVKDFLVIVDKEGINHSLANFVKYTKKNYENSKRNAITRRFASDIGRSDGWKNVLIMLGRKPKKFWKVDEIIDFYYKVFKENRGKEPTAREIEKAGMSSSTVANFFREKKFGIPNEDNHGGHYKAIYLMYQKYKIEKKIEIPEYSINKPRYYGEELTKYGIDTEKLGIELGPVNEQGVVALFSKIHKYIGFPKINYINDYFPDCEARCNIGKKENYRANIEFKYNLRKTYISKNDLKKWLRNVNYIICWENGNKSLTEKIRPIKVISLRDLLKEVSIIKKINEN